MKNKKLQDCLADNRGSEIFPFFQIGVIPELLISLSAGWADEVTDLMREFSAGAALAAVDPAAMVWKIFLGDSDVIAEKINRFPCRDFQDFWMHHHAVKLAGRRRPDRADGKVLSPTAGQE